nr:large T-antigen [Lemur mastadenovirus]
MEGDQEVPMAVAAAAGLPHGDVPMQAPEEVFPPEAASATPSQPRVRPLEAVTYSHICVEVASSGRVFSQNYSFEQVKTYNMEPWENWEEVIKVHAKVSLDPSKVYEITEPICITNLAYICGNGATVRVRCDAPVVFSVSVKEYRPRITGWEKVVFCQTRFVRDSGVQKVFLSAKSTIAIHGCDFVGFLGKVLELNHGGSVRGCYFVGCFQGVYVDCFFADVRSCVFDKCVMGVFALSDVGIYNNQSFDTPCFLYLKRAAVVRNNTYQRPCEREQTIQANMVTCREHDVIPLGGIHIASSKDMWPFFIKNNLVHCKVYLGDRRGVIDFRKCTFFYCTLVVHRDSMTKFNLKAAYDSTLQVYKMDGVQAKTRMRLCECGTSHALIYPKLLDISDHVKSDRLVDTVEARVYTSDSEDDE